jgi:LMBR1 domain-containing protein 1
MIMSFYLLICVIKGNLMLNSTISSAIGIHPFKVNGTWISSFLVNSFFLLSAGFGMLFFLCSNFESFLRSTACDRVIKNIIMNSRYIKYLFIYNVFNYAIVAIFLVILVYLLWIPSKKSHINKLMREKKIEREKANAKQD